MSDLSKSLNLSNAIKDNQVVSDLYKIVVTLDMQISSLNSRLKTLITQRNEAYNKIAPAIATSLNNNGIV